jgi:small subunit ribosomal protein S19
LKLKEKKQQEVILKKKNSIILPEYINLFFKIYNGKQYLQLKVIGEMVGHKFGEFIFTRKLRKKDKKKKKKEKNKIKSKKRMKLVNY